MVVEVLQHDRGCEGQPTACPDSNADSNRAEPGHPSRRRLINLAEVEDP